AAFLLLGIVGRLLAVLFLVLIFVVLLFTGRSRRGQLLNLVQSLTDILLIGLFNLGVGDLLFGFVKEGREVDLEIGEGELVRPVEARLIDIGIGIAIFALIEQLLHFGVGRLAFDLCAQRLDFDGIG